MPRRVGSPQIRKAYYFLIDAEAEDRCFTLADLSRASGWTDGTADAYISKKLHRYVHKSGDGFTCSGLHLLSEDTFCRLFSQNATLASDPARPIFDQRVEGLVQKAREAALAAVQHYNNPTSVFRSGNYIVLMVIGYTALFHAICERDGIDYVVRDKATGCPKLSDGEPMLWDALRAAKAYDQNPKSSMVNNLEFMFRIRHKIEHRFMPVLDPAIAGHCQAMLMNFEEILVREFTAYYSLNTSLSLALQFSAERATETVDAMRRCHSAEYDSIKAFIDDFHQQLPLEVLGDPKFEFRVWLIPKSATSARKGDIAIDFVSLADVSSGIRNDLERQIAAIVLRRQCVESWDEFKFTVTDLAKQLGLTTWKIQALVLELRLQDDQSCFRSFSS